jgi:hypothetical protein
VPARGWAVSPGFEPILGASQIIPLNQIFTSNISEILTIENS